MHGRERISGQRGSRTGEARVRMLLIPTARPGALVSQRADLVRELMRAGYIVSARVTAPKTRRIIKVIVLELDEGGFAALGDRRAGRRAVAAVPAGWPRRHRAKARMMKMLLHVRIGASVTGAPAAATATTSTAAAGRSTTARHTIRGRGTRRTGVARPEWAPQVREVERRRAARTLHLRHDVDAAATAHDLRKTRRRRCRRRASSVRGPNFRATLRDEHTERVRLCRPSVGINAASRHWVARELTAAVG